VLGVFGFLFEIPIVNLVVSVIISVNSLTTISMFSDEGVERLDVLISVREVKRF
jgi:hypothetical protein